MGFCRQGKTVLLTTVSVAPAEQSLTPRRHSVHVLLSRPGQGYLGDRARLEWELECLGGEDRLRGNPYRLEQALGIWVMVPVHHSGACHSGTWQDEGQAQGSGIVDRSRGGQDER